jgi:hypothetical protein
VQPVNHAFCSQPNFDEDIPIGTQKLFEFYNVELRPQHPSMQTPHGIEQLINPPMQRDLAKP